MDKTLEKKIKDENLPIKSQLKTHMVFWIIEFCVVGALQGGAYYLRTGTKHFYRWDEQEWWNWYPEEGQTNVIDQLGDFSSM